MFHPALPTDFSHPAHLKPPSEAKVVVLMLLLATLLLGACSQVYEPGSATSTSTSEELTSMPTSTPLINEKLYAAVANGQIIVDGDVMRIGVGNLESDDQYADETGATRRGNTAGLWFYFRDRPDLDQHMRVHEDQVFEMLGHEIRVVSIDPESRQVVLGIVQPDATATATPAE